MEGPKPYRPYHLRQACCTCGQLNNIMWASLRFPLLSYLSSKQTTKYLILCARSQTDCNFIPAVFLSLQWLPLAVGFVYTLQRKSIFYICHFYVAKYVLISIMLYIKISGYNVCTNMWHTTHNHLQTNDELPYRPSCKCKLAAIARWHSVSQISSNTYPIISTLPLFLYIVTGGHSFPHDDRKL